MLRLIKERVLGDHPPDPEPDEVPRGTTELAAPEGAVDELRATFVGHATFLLQWGGLNILTDPHFTARASPLTWVGPKRFAPPGLSLDQLPRIDAVVLSHDHYDHLDKTTVLRLHERFGAGLTWLTPLGYRSWFRGLGVESVEEFDWWEGRPVDLTGSGSSSVRLEVEALPAQHWTRRGRNINQRLWASWALRFRSGGGDGPAFDLYFGGDSAYFQGYEEIGRRAGPFHGLLLPIGAYEPRWFMRHHHMNPEETVQAYQDLGETGHCVGMHWGAFRLTFEDPLEPPERMRRAWAAAELDPGQLHLPGLGGTVRMRSGY